MQPETADLSRLLALAEAATPGPWHVNHAPWMGLQFGVFAGAFKVAGPCGESPIDEAGSHGPEPIDEHNAAYIAACSPDVVAALCRIIADLREQLADRIDYQRAYFALELLYNQQSDKNRELLVRAQRLEEALRDVRGWLVVAKTQDSFGDTVTGIIYAMDQIDAALAGKGEE